jgi:hypothetical protein
VPIAGPRFGGMVRRPAFAPPRGGERRCCHCVSHLFICACGGWWRAASARACDDRTVARPVAVPQPVYHSRFLSTPCDTISGFAILPVRVSDCLLLRLLPRRVCFLASRRLTPVVVAQPKVLPPPAPGAPPPGVLLHCVLLMHDCGAVSVGRSDGGEACAT